MPEKKKRKTTTSTAVKQRYIKKTYTSISAMLPKELVAEFKAKVKSSGDSQAAIIKTAVIAYLEKDA